MQTYCDRCCQMHHSSPMLEAPQQILWYVLCVSFESFAFDGFRSAVEFNFAREELNGAEGRVRNKSAQMFQTREERVRIVCCFRG